MCRHLVLAMLIAATTLTTACYVHKDLDDEECQIGTPMDGQGIFVIYSDGGGFSGEGAGNDGVILDDGTAQRTTRDGVELECGPDPEGIEQLRADLEDSGVYDVNEGCYEDYGECFDCFGDSLLIQDSGWYRFSRSNSAGPDELEQAVQMVIDYLDETLASCDEEPEAS